MNCRKDLNIKICWIDNQDSAKLRPQSVEVSLFKNGLIYQKVQVLASNNWSYTFKCLIYGPSIKYKIEQSPVSGYRQECDGSEITNTLNTLKGSITFTSGLHPRIIKLYLFENKVLKQIQTVKIKTNTTNYQFYNIDTDKNYLVTGDYLSAYKTYNLRYHFYYVFHPYYKVVYLTKYAKFCEFYYYKNDLYRIKTIEEVPLKKEKFCYWCTRSGDKYFGGEEIKITRNVVLYAVYC